VAMCTYQGEKYLQEQLESIVAQERPPDEIVISDDDSTDGTRRILERFRSRASFPVRLHVNHTRLGSTKNFESAIGLCEGDIIFLADQDDIWHSKKLSTLTEIFLTSPAVGAVFTNADVVDDRSRALDSSLWEAVRFDAPLRKRFSKGEALDVLLRTNVVTGATMGFRARYRDLIVPIPHTWFHDHWIAVLVAAVADLAMVPRRLVQYRHHKEQAVGIPEASHHARRTLRDALRDGRRMNAGPEGYLRLADQQAAAYERLAAMETYYPCSSTVLRRLKARIEHLRARADLRSGKGSARLLMVQALGFNYHRYSSGWKSIAADLLHR
jgi:glycosyltransferase involved in cell wall biosynthesis